MRLRFQLATCLLFLVSIPYLAQVKDFRPVTDAMLQKPDPANWLMWRRTLDSWGYSPLNQVNRANVSQLRLVWTRGLGPGNTQEETPLVYDGVMYIANPGDYIQAINAKSRCRLGDFGRNRPGHSPDNLP